MDNQSPNYGDRFDQAIADFWRIQREQEEKQIAKSGTRDAGRRARVTGGKHLHPLSDLITSVFRDAGFPRSSIHVGQDAQLPGYFRQQKNWDIIVLHGESVVATIELKSQSRSFGNNLNNRVEEAVGQTFDFWTAHKHNLIPGMRPWFGYLMVVEDHKNSRDGGNKVNRKCLFTPDPELVAASYLEKYLIAFERLISERQLDAMCYAVSKEDSDHATFPAATMTFDFFARLIRDRCSQVIAAMGPPPEDDVLF